MKQTNHAALSRMETNQELLMAVDSNDAVLHSVGKIEVHRGAGVLHRAFTVFLKNRENHWLVTRRSQLKPLWPEYWDGACSSHPWYPNETVIAAAQRRLPFELGAVAESVENLLEIGLYEYHVKYSAEWSENEINHILVGEYDGELVPNDAEVQAFDWISHQAVEELLDRPDWFAPWVKQAWLLVTDHLAAQGMLEQVGGTTRHTSD